MFFTFLARKTLWVKLFSLNVCEAALQAAIKGGNFGAKLTHLCGFWLDVSFFSHVKKHRSRFWLDVSFFFTCKNHRSLLWLARTNLRTKIYDIAFWWVFLSMYIINTFPWCPLAESPVRTVSYGYLMWYFMEDVNTPLDESSFPFRAWMNPSTPAKFASIWQIERG